MGTAGPAFTTKMGQRAIKYNHPHYHRGSIIGVYKLISNEFKRVLLATRGHLAPGSLI